MTNVLKRELRANWKGLLFWGLGLLALAGIGFGEYAGLANTGASINQIFALMPRIVRVIFGMGMLDIATAPGYYACMFVWLCFVAYTYAALLGAGILSKEEQDKTAEFLFTRPLTRGAAVAGKALAGLLNIVVIWALAFGVTAAVFLPQLPDNSFAPEITKTMLGMLLTMVVYFAVGLLCAAAAKNNKQATQWAAAAVVASYFVSALVEMANKEVLSFLSPFRYFNAAKVIQDGIQPVYVLLAVAVTAAAGVGAWRVFARRDLQN